MASTRTKPSKRTAKAANGAAPAHPKSISPPEPNLTQREMIERAAAMRGLLREHQAEAETIRRIPPVVQDAAVKAGFYRILQPRRFGGYEFDLPTFGRTMIEVARGDPSSAWVIAFTAGHTHVLSKYAEAAQVWAYGDNGEFRGPLVGAGVTGSSAKVVDGGYIIEGVWDYSSGCQVATHFFGTAMVETGDPETPRQMISALFSRNDYEIVENWEMLGMRGSGSHRVIAKDLFVPTERINTMALGARDEREQPGYGVHKNPLYAGPSINVLMTEIAAVGIGTGYCALDAYEEIMRKRSGFGPNAPLRIENVDYQRYYGNALALLDTARDALIGCTNDFMEWCRMDVEEDIRFDADKMQRITAVQRECSRLAGEAAELLVYSAGSSAMKPGTLLERTWRDMTTLRTHITLQHDSSYAPLARAHFGLPPLPGERGNRGGFPSTPPPPK